MKQVVMQGKSEFRIEEDAFPELGGAPQPGSNAQAAPAKAMPRRVAPGDGIQGEANTVTY